MIAILCIYIYIYIYIYNCYVRFVVPLIAPNLLSLDVSAKRNKKITESIFSSALSWERRRNIMGRNAGALPRSRTFASSPSGIFSGSRTFTWAGFSFGSFPPCVNLNGQGPMHALLSLARFRVSRGSFVAAVLQVGRDDAPARSDTAKL